MEASQRYLHRDTITTERLILRPPEKEDAGAITQIVGDWSVASNLARVPHPYTSDDAQFFLQQIVPHEWVWAIRHNQDPSLIGTVGLTPEQSENKQKIDTAELGYWLSPAFWNRGFVTEAAKAVIEYGFNQLSLETIVSGYFEANPRSGRVLEKLGFVKKGNSLRPCLARAEDMPSVDVYLSRNMHSLPNISL